MAGFAIVLLLLPLLSFILCLCFAKSLKEKAANLASILLAGSFFVACTLLFLSFKGVGGSVQAPWLQFGETTITVGLSVNELNALMLFVVTLVSLLVHIYAKGYMDAADRERLPIFYAYLGLFTFSMLGLVLSPNLLQLYMFWELVGMCSFLLIGFYFSKPAARAAAKKAFIMTRIGDMGLFIGMMLLFWQTGSLELAVIFEAVNQNQFGEGMLTLTAILLFIGAVGKSGQLPLHTWLPDAMEGPTPVSALIHAATMVAAGVYLVATMFPVFLAAPAAMSVVAVVGGVTAFFAAVVALGQTDIKRILAYSTVSQLGYMMLALGSAGYVAAMFHFMTHAFFKALLFLAAGSVIHAVHTQNIERMGGLWKRLPVTGPLFLIGCLAIAGVPVFSGFFSKEEILLTVLADGRFVLFGLALLTSILTAFYMFRLFYLVFMGSPRHKITEVHEAPAVMKGPMVVLAILAVISGFVHTHWFGTFFGDWFSGAQWIGVESVSAPIWVMIVASACALMGIGLAYQRYGKEPQKETKGEGLIQALLQQGFYIDALYQRTVVFFTTVVSYLAYYLEIYVVQVVEQMVTGTINALGKTGAKLQNGHVQTYSLTAFLGIVVLFVLLSVTGGYLR
ncbi:NADH-quinone oxidoreductase subunit L [Halalkalibacterium ligniniphilum]|uniref:NADH-quinone oxidoreductase subunit L n=2 Tax=Halalkalibacterium ligniniphilum TaxID=1134413 RepID=UPI00034A23CD|nr:NADH-quinone oxidoreductase subunit L [Halalkalibacterium ligniniphilum]